MLRIDLTELDRAGHAGDWCFVAQEQYIGIKFPDVGYGELISVLPIIRPLKGKSWWDWNGDKHKPTLTGGGRASDGIRLFVTEKDGTDKQIWYGYLRAGKLIQA